MCVSALVLWVMCLWFFGPSFEVFSGGNTCVGEPVHTEPLDSDMFPPGEEE